MEIPSKEYRKVVSKKAGKKSKNPSPTKSSTSVSSSDEAHSPKRSEKRKENEIKNVQPSSKSEEKPKSLESAIRSLTPESFQTELAILKETYPGSELLWLRGIATYLNTELPFESDPTFSGKSIHFPSKQLSKELKQTIVAFLESMGETNVTYFYHSMLASMCVDMTKNSPVIGYKLLLQLIGQKWPKICSDDMAKTAMLRNSYQNRSNICLSIFWAIAQGGYQEVMHGIKVWQNLMLTNLEMRSYSKFVVDYFERILNPAIVQSLAMDQQTFFDIYNVLRKQYSGLPRESQESLGRSCIIFLHKYIYSSKKHANIFLQLFREVKNSEQNSTELSGCISCLLMGDESFKVWKMNLKKQIIPSTLLIEQIVKEWCNVGSALANSKSFQKFLVEVQELTNEMKQSKKKIPGLDSLCASLKNAQQVTQQKKKQSESGEKKSGCCKWLWGSLILIALIAGALTYDTNVNGRGVFAASATGKMLKNAGLLPYAEKAWYVPMSAAARGYKWAEVHVPPYAKPAGQLASDLYKMGRNLVCNSYESLSKYIAAKLPVAGAFLEQYIPGSPAYIENVYSSVKNATIYVRDASVDFVYEKVLIGKWSPTNIQKALNETQNAAWGYYNVFHKKIDAYAKLK